MEFASNKEEFCQDDHHHHHHHHHQHNNQTGKAILHFSHNSSSSSSPSSLVPCFNNPWDQQTGCWLGNKEHQDDHKNEESDHHATVVEEEGRSTGSVVSIVVEKEHMFDKVVTPSDVGKLNRLVIPKQHAEKYFPLDSAANEKGLLLNFEDRNGKPWRFRYSYWNSSQSYVMTKGWSRFVKDKKLDAGDIVSFQRGVGESGKDRLYIDWRRRPDAPEQVSFPLHHHHHLSFHRSIPWSPLLMRPPPPSSAPPMSRDHLHLSQMNHFLNRNGFYGGVSSSGGDGGGMGSVYYLRSQPLQSHPLQMGMSMGEWQHHHHQYQHQQHYHPHHQQVVLQQEENTMVFDSVPVVQGKAAAKRLRLFGVNMDCPISDTTTTTSTTDDDDNEIDTVLSSSTVQHASMPTIQQPPQHYHQQQVSSSQAAASHHQLRLYNGTAIDFLNKGKASMSFD